MLKIWKMIESEEIKVLALELLNKGVHKSDKTIS